VITWFNFSREPYEEHWIVTPDGTDKAPLDESPAKRGTRRLFDVQPCDLMLAAFRTRTGRSKIDYSVPSRMTDAQAKRLQTWLAVYQRVTA
jgi:hypothetical protein